MHADKKNFPCLNCSDIRSFIGDAKKGANLFKVIDTPAARHQPSVENKADVNSRHDAPNVITSVQAREIR